MKAKVAGSDRFLNVERSPARERDWPARKDGRLKDDPPPPARDLRAGRPWFKVQDQEQTGSCVGFALADAVMRWQLVEQRRLLPTERLSARFIWMASKEIRGQRLAPEEWRPSTFLEEAPTNAKDALDVVLPLWRRHAPDAAVGRPAQPRAGGPLLRAGARFPHLRLPQPRRHQPGRAREAMAAMDRISTDPC